MSSQNGQHPDGERYQSQVTDLDQLSHQEKQALLEKSRERVLEVRTEARGRMAAGKLSRMQARQYYRGAIETLLIQLNPILERHETGENYLEGVNLGTINFTPTEELVEYAEDNIIRLPKGCKVPTPKTVEIDGLRSIIELPSPLQVSWQVTVDKKGGPEQKKSAEQKEIPFAVLDSTMQTVDRAMNDIGLGYEIDQESEASGEYSDILDE